MERRPGYTAAIEKSFRMAQSDLQAHVDGMNWYGPSAPAGDTAPDS
jgi:hypothetical protein